MLAGPPPVMKTRLENHPNDAPIPQDDHQQLHLETEDELNTLEDQIPPLPLRHHSSTPSPQTEAPPIVPRRRDEKVDIDSAEDLTQSSEDISKKKKGGIKALFQGFKSKKNSKSKHNVEENDTDHEPRTSHDQDHEEHENVIAMKPPVPIKNRPDSTTDSSIRSETPRPDSITESPAQPPVIPRKPPVPRRSEHAEREEVQEQAPAIRPRPRPPVPTPTARTSNVEIPHETEEIVSSPVKNSSPTREVFEEPVDAQPVPPPKRKIPGLVAIPGMVHVSPPVMKPRNLRPDSESDASSMSASESEKRHPPPKPKQIPKPEVVAVEEDVQNHPVLLSAPLNIKKVLNSVSGDDKLLEKNAIEWMNLHLVDQNIPVTNLISTLQDGVSLIHALEVL